jgi:fructose-1,6-bisphosphatase/inositol monophosphatase family enzyme
MNDSSLLMMTSNCCNARGEAPGYVHRWMAQTTWKIRMLGSAALEAVQVAAGIAHGAVTVHGKLWDVAAPAALLLEAGGVLSDLAGHPIFPFNLSGYAGAKVPFLAAGLKAHAELLREIVEHP